MKKIAVFPGSFDPITKGHESIINRASLLFDHVIVAIGENSSKKTLFDINQRKQWIEDTFKNHSIISVECYKGLTVNFCKTKNANFIIRGLRNSLDFEYEQTIALMNKKLAPNIETVLLYTQPEFSMISSSTVRDIIKNNGNAEQFLPNAIKLD